MGVIDIVGWSASIAMCFLMMFFCFLMIGATVLFVSFVIQTLRGK